MGLFILNNNYSYEIVKKCASTFQCQISPLTIVIIHSDGRYEFVRGCHSAFMNASSNSNLTKRLNRATGELVADCSINLVASQRVFSNEVFKPARAGMRYCSLGIDKPKLCNNYFVDDGQDPNCDTPAGV